MRNLKAFVDDEQRQLPETFSLAVLRPVLCSCVKRGLSSLIDFPPLTDSSTYSSQRLSLSFTAGEFMMVRGVYSLAFDTGYGKAYCIFYFDVSFGVLPF